jgi:hypothetical protein
MLLALDRSPYGLRKQVNPMSKSSTLFGLSNLHCDMILTAEACRVDTLFLLTLDHTREKDPVVPLPISSLLPDLFRMVRS